jgi:hypothetical protein
MSVEHAASLPAAAASVHDAMDAAGKLEQHSPRMVHVSTGLDVSVGPVEPVPVLMEEDMLVLEPDPLPVEVPHSLASAAACAAQLVASVVVTWEALGSREVLLGKPPAFDTHVRYA